jgi:uncharacterized protein (TIGR02118 family)
MVKLVILFSRRPELTQEAFEEYWRNDHAQLVNKLADALRLRRYVQSRNIHHGLIDAFAAARGFSGAADGLVEVWWESEEEMQAAFASPEGQAASAELSEDEARFCDMSTAVAFLSVENEVLDRA